MKLHNLTTYNFMPYKGDMELLFPLDEHRNVMLVFGDNMRGKTSLLNAIRWAFYGKALGRHSKPIPLQEIVNKEATREGEWKVEAHVKFEANDCVYDLRRVADRREQVSKPSRPEDFSQAVYLTRDGSPIPGDQVEAEIGYIVPEQTSRFFLFDGELLQEYETLLIENDQQGQQIKEAIEQVLGVPALTNGRVDIQTILKEAQKRQSSDLKRVAGLKAQAEHYDELMQKIEAVDRDQEKLKERLAKTEEEKNALDDELEAVQLISDLAGKLHSAQERQGVLSETYNKKEVERLNLLSEAWKDMIEAQLRAKLNQLNEQREKSMNSIKARSGLTQKIESLQQLLSTRECPTCGQVLSEGYHPHINKILSEAEEKLQSIDDNSSELQIALGQIEALSKIRGINAKDRLEQVEQDLQEYQVRLTQVENEIENLKDKIADYDTSDIARKRKLRDEKVKEEGRLQQDIQEQNIRIKDLNEQLAISQKAIQASTRDRTQRSTIEVLLCSDLEKIFSRSIEELRNELRNRVENLANDAFRKMTTQKNYRGLEINENYGLQIIDASGDYVAVRSAGAEQIVALSLIDGLNRTGRSSGPVIMDTPFGRLDLNHRDNILSYLPSVTSQFVLLVHSGEIRKETDLLAISSRVGISYDIKEISSTQSRLERITL